MHTASQILSLMLWRIQNEKFSLSKQSDSMNIAGLNFANVKKGWTWVYKSPIYWVSSYLVCFLTYNLGKITLTYNWIARINDISSVQSLSHVWLFVTPWTAARQASLSITNSWSLLKLMSIESVMPSNHLTLCHPLFPLPSIFLSIRVFSKESVLRIKCPRSFSFSISPSNEYSGLISFRMDWFDLLGVQGTLKHLL